MDGRCAGAIVARYTNNYNPEDYFEVDYLMDLPIDCISEDEDVYLVDYSFKENTIWQLEKIFQKTKNVVWCDHHSSSLNLINSRPELNCISGIRKEGISGAALIYMYLYDVDELDFCPKFVQYVSDYDCWKYNLSKSTTYFKLGLEMHNFNALDDIWISLLELDNFLDILTLNKIIADGEKIKQFIDKDNAQYLKNFGYKSIINGLPCYVVNKKSNSWIFGDKINEYPVVVVYAFNGDKYSYSIFSTNKDVDCSKIAESFGGGGHKGAAGFCSSKLLFKKS
jgi:oligoribonuclease NrnB/cAMP/cGMP phosphodiesterase (DHH superfamily)